MMDGKEEASLRELIGQRFTSLDSKLASLDTKLDAMNEAKALQAKEYERRLSKLDDKTDMNALIIVSKTDKGESSIQHEELRRRLAALELRNAEATGKASIASVENAQGSANTGKLIGILASVVAVLGVAMDIILHYVIKP